MAIVVQREREVCAGVVVTGGGGGERDGEMLATSAGGKERERYVDAAVVKLLFSVVVVVVERERERVCVRVYVHLYNTFRKKKDYAYKAIELYPMKAKNGV